MVKIRRLEVTELLRRFEVTELLRRFEVTELPRRFEVTDNKHTIDTINECRCYLICCDSAATALLIGEKPRKYPHKSLCVRISVNN